MINPSEVISPKTSWRLIDVLYDGGRDADAVALGMWDDKPVLAMRWNGGKSAPLGNPQSRGLPTWFILPDWTYDAIITAGDFGLDKEKLARAVLGR